MEAIGLRIKIPFEIDAETAPALRSAVEELSTLLGTRVEKGSFLFKREQAIADAVRAVGELRAAVNSIIPKEDENYG